MHVTWMCVIICIKFLGNICAGNICASSLSHHPSPCMVFSFTILYFQSISNQMSCTLFSLKEPEKIYHETVLQILQLSCNAGFVEIIYFSAPCQTVCFSGAQLFQLLCADLSSANKNGSFKVYNFSHYINLGSWGLHWFCRKRKAQTMSIYRLPFAHQAVLLKWCE